MKTTGKLGLLSCLYLSQGLPFGFFTQALPAILRDEGVSLPAIGLTHLLVLPWALKFLWAPLVDRYSVPWLGQRRTWILSLQLAAAVAMVVLSQFEPAGGVMPILVGFFVANLIAATQDIATDGLAVSLLDYHERGLGNGVQVAGYRVGMIVGGGVLLIIFDELGWSRTFLVMAMLLALATVPVWRYRERPGSTVAKDRGVLPMLWAFVRRPGATAWLLVLVVYKGFDVMATAMLRPMLVDAGLTMTDIGWMLGTAGFTAGLVGALAGGWALGKLGRRRGLITFGVLQAVAVAAYLLPAYGIVEPTTLYTVAIVEHFAGGMATAALFTLMMDACRVETAGTDYTLQASVVVVATGIASAISGFLAESLGYAGLIALAAMLCIAGVLLAARLTMRPSVRALLRP